MKYGPINSQFEATGALTTPALPEETRYKANDTASQLKYRVALFSLSPQLMDIPRERS